VVAAGVLAAARGLGHRITLVGPRERVETELRDQGAAVGEVEVVDAPEVVTMDESPARAVRRKQRSSVVVGIRLCREGRGEAFVSAGSTGALMAAGLFELGRIGGVERPAIGSTFPTVDGRGCFMLDIGAQVEATPEQLYQYGLMGSEYVRAAAGIERPRVGLLNMGTEASKGPGAVRGAYRLLAHSNLNFVGNIEGRDVPRGAADVLVCDGFTGNIAIKFTEGVAEAMFGLIKQGLSSSTRGRLAGLVGRPVLKAVAGKLDYREYGGAPLLGLDGIVVKCHGSSDAFAIRNGIKVAGDLAAGGLVARIAENVSQVVGKEG